MSEPRPRPLAFAPDRGNLSVSEQRPGFICNPCDKSCDGGDYLQAEQNSQAAGFLNVHAAGNAGDPGSRSVNPPASFRQGLALAALNSTDRLSRTRARRVPAPPSRWRLTAGATAVAGSA